MGGRLRGPCGLPEGDLPGRAVTVLPVPRVVGERHIPLGDSPRFLRCGIRHDAGRLGPAGAECGLCLQGLHKALLPQAQAERPELWSDEQKARARVAAALVAREVQP